MMFQIQDFRPTEPLGASDTARSWLAEPTSGGDPVVLTFRGPELRDQLLRRCELARFVEHPHLISTLGVAASAARVALVTTYAAGGNLADRLAAGVLRPGQTVTVLAALSLALAACHPRGVVHGDIAASRVLFAADGRPILAGVGAVQAAIETGAPAELTAGYLSAEVARSQSPGPADDIFAVAAVALHCLSGSAAWPAETLRDVVVQSAFGQWPAPAESVPAALAGLLRRMLDRDPSRRPTAGEILNLLPGCGAAEPVDLVSSPPGRHAEPQSESSMPDDHVPSGAGESLDDTSFEIPAGSPDAGISWLDVSSMPSWSLSGQPAAVDAPVSDTAATISPTDTTPTGDVQHPPPRTRRVAGRAALSVFAFVVAVASVLAGLWWARSDGPSAGSVPPTDSSAVVATASAVTARTWLAIVRDLDQRRSDAFSAADPTLLSQVYVAGAAALQVDSDRINNLKAAGYRIDSLTHDVQSVELIDGSPGSRVVLSVRDSLAVFPIRDSTGAVVGETAGRPAAERSITVVELADGYRIVAVTNG